MAQQTTNGTNVEELEARFREEHPHSKTHTEGALSRCQFVRVLECEICGGSVSWYERNDKPHSGSRDVVKYRNKEINECEN